MAYRDLREFLQDLENQGEVLKIKAELNPRFEMSAVMKLINDRAVQFENITGHPGKKAVANILGTRGRVARLMGVPEETLTPGFIDRKSQHIAPRVVNGGPVKEVVLRENIDLISLLPALTYHEKDASPYLTSAIIIAGDPETGVQNIGLHRIQIKGGNRLGILLANPPVATFWQKAEAAGQGLAVAIALGVDPAITLGTMTKATAEGPNKFAVAGGIKGEAIELTPAESSDLLVPAHAELILEGRIIPNYREQEGPFGESSGSYFEFQSPVIEVHTVTHRHDFIYQFMQVWGAEPDVILSLGVSADNLSNLKRLVPALREMNFSPGTCMFNAVASVHGASPLEVRQLMTLILSMDQRIKQIIVVDDDVNIYDMREVQWALATRFQADRDMLLLTGLKGYVIDHSKHADGSTSKLGLDATKKGGSPDQFEKITVPGESLARARQALK
ncbi:MAG: UbiD family decarboxylase [Thermincola sp.]|jgi:2,5-furandicarboxylate decarboxylase 1|nr:UbiD family decarboxylase [Thermincola sp.]MDT3701843.1 UbiD family decarboxylase [Thermincola sp.]